MVNQESIFKITKELRSQYRFAEAYELLNTKIAGLKIASEFVWAHQPILWSDIIAGICKLTRRRKEDAEFIVAVWKNKDFVYQFHRHARDLTNNIELLRSTLDQEYTSVITENNQLHWVVRDKTGKAFGLLSLTNISFLNKSAEVLLGVLPDAPRGLSVASMLVLFQFFFKAMGFHKLYTFIYEDNPHSLKGTLHLGFKQEGLLREHVVDPATGRFVNLIQTGLLASEVDSPSNFKLMEKLLKK